MLIVQYPMQFSGPPGSIINLYVQHRLPRANGGSNNMTRVHAFHALLLPSNIMLRVPYLLHGRRLGHS